MQVMNEYQKQDRFDTNASNRKQKTLSETAGREWHPNTKTAYIAVQSKERSKLFRCKPWRKL